MSAGQSARCPPTQGECYGSAGCCHDSLWPPCQRLSASLHPSLAKSPLFRGLLNMVDPPSGPQHTAPWERDLEKITAVSYSTIKDLMTLRKLHTQPNMKCADFISSETLTPLSPRVPKVLTEPSGAEWLGAGVLSLMCPLQRTLSSPAGSQALGGRS